MSSFSSVFPHFRKIVPRFSCRCHSSIECSLINLKPHHPFIRFSVISSVISPTSNCFFFQNVISILYNQSCRCSKFNSIVIYDELVVVWFGFFLWSHCHVRDLHLLSFAVAVAVIFVRSLVLLLSLCFCRLLSPFE